jgi:hypothetical protein
VSTVLLLEREDVVVARRPRLRDHLAARLRSWSLDRELALGVPPEASTVLALRAQALVRPASRKQLAEDIDGIIRRARDGRMFTRGEVPLRRRAVLRAAGDLERLAEALRAPGPVAARGVARVRLLLTDGRGALYYDRGDDADPSDLSAAASSALDGLELRVPAGP